MFGHQEQNDQTNSTAAVPIPEPQADATLTATDPATPAPTADPTTTSAPPIIGEEDIPSDLVIPEPSVINDGLPDDTTDKLADSLPLVGRNNNTANDLLDLKQNALQELSPLLGHLDQTPEEKFRTTMMMIQASDDQSLLQAAYEAAHQIDDEKIRAQALLDVVNEINYFTQQQQDNPNSDASVTT